MMENRVTRRRVRLLLWFGIVALLFSAAGAQSVADVAKKNKEQSKEKKARIVITDETLKSSPSGPSTQSAGETATTPGEWGKKQEETKKLTEDRYQEYREGYRRLRIDLVKAQTRMQQAMIHGDNTALDIWRDKATKLQKRIANLKQQAIKDGVGPSMFRDVDRELGIEFDPNASSSSGLHH